MKYQVLESGKPADCSSFYMEDKSWSKSTFDSLEEAIDYARKWFAEYFPSCEIEVNKIYDVSGYGDTMEIREIE